MQVLGWAGMVRRTAAASGCEVCRRWGQGRLCSPCLQAFASPVPRCACCGLRTGQPVARCGACLQTAPPFASTTCAVDYDFPWDKLLAQFKYQGQVELAGPLAGVMLRGQPPAVDALLPVPLASARLAERGYNQAWELARRLGAALGRPARADVLLRPLAPPVRQAESTRAERQRNLRAAFMVAPAAQAWVQGRQLALVDDVMTTGATASEAAQTLLRAGATAVHLWVLARTPAPGAAGPGG